MSDSLTFEIPMALLRETVAAEVRNFFSAPSHAQRDGGAGRRAIARTVAAQAASSLASGAVQEIVAEAIATHLPGVVREEVGEFLSKLVKAELVKVKREGTIQQKAADQLRLQAPEGAGG